MTGDPNQQNRPNIFGYDFNNPPNFPSTSANASSEWNRFAGNNFYMKANFPFCANYGPSPITFPTHSNSKNGNIFGPMYNYQGNTSSFSSNNSHKCYKRKCDDPLPSPVKQHITEEKMAEHLSKLHISSESKVPEEDKRAETKRLYMCEEMRKLQHETILPESILSKLNSPCTALVLWQPPRRILPAFNFASNLDENNDNNNEEEIPDQNLMEMDR